MRHLLAVLIVVAAVSPLRAQEYRDNAWGIVFAPMNYHIAKGYNVETHQTYTSLDCGLFYTRFFTPSWSGRFEVLAVERSFNTYAPVAGATDLAYFVVEENTIQSTLVFDLDRRFALGECPGRVSIGAGLMLAGIYDETVTRWFPLDTLSSSDPGEGTYLKWGWLVEGGMSVTFYRQSAIFARLRMQQDEDTFGASDDADITRKLAAFGFHVGMEFEF